MTGLNHPTSDPIQKICNLLDEAAELYMTHYDADAVRSQDPSRFEMDLRALGLEPGDSLFWDRVYRLSGIYLFESAHEIKALATLLRSAQIAGSLELLSRAVVERCGRVSWLLDHESRVTPTIRSARIALELGVSWQEYRILNESRYTRAHVKTKDAVRRFREIRNAIETTFTVSKTNDSAYVRDWILDGTSYPDYTELATWTWFGAKDKSKLAKATYRMLCSFSHPSYAASLEHQFSTDKGVGYRYDHKYISDVTHNAVAAFDHAFQAFSSYFDRSFILVVAHQESVAALWPAFSSEAPNAGKSFQ